MPMPARTLAAVPPALPRIRPTSCTLCVDVWMAKGPVTIPRIIWYYLGILHSAQSAKYPKQGPRVLADAVGKRSRTNGKRACETGSQKNGCGDSERRKSSRKGNDWTISERVRPALGPWLYL